MTQILKTKKRIEREAKYRAMYADYCTLVKEKRSDVMGIIAHLVTKHKISQSAIFRYLRTQKR